LPLKLHPSRKTPQATTAVEAVPNHPQIVISTEAADSRIVRRAVEKPPHFAFAFAAACRLSTTQNRHFDRSGETRFSPLRRPHLLIAATLDQENASGRGEG
jgi:hypothetical protein